MKFAVIAFLIGSAFAADKLTVEKAMQVREPQDLQFSPDGKRVAFVVQEPVKDRDVVPPHLGLRSRHARDAAVDHLDEIGKRRRAGRRTGNRSRFCRIARKASRST